MCNKDQADSNNRACRNCGGCKRAVICAAAVITGAKRSFLTENPNAYPITDFMPPKQNIAEAAQLLAAEGFDTKEDPCCVVLSGSKALFEAIFQSTASPVVPASLSQYVEGIIFPQPVQYL